MIRAKERLAMLPAVLAAILGGLAWGNTIDDAFILGRYARRLARGLGHTFRDGPATDGVTGPIALLWQVPSAAVGLDPVFVTKSLGLVAVSVAFVLRGRAVAGHRMAAGAIAWMSIGTLACAFVAMHAVSGLETGVATLAFTGLASRIEPRLRAFAALTIAGLRPELIPAAATLIALDSSRADRRLLGASLALGVVGIALYRAALFGNAIPLSARAKPADLAEGLAYVARSSVWLAPVLVPLARVRPRPAAVLAAHLAALSLAGGDWMPGHRLFVPLMPWLLGEFALSMRAVPRLAHIAVGLGLVLPIAVGVVTLGEARAVEQSRKGPGSILRDHLEAVSHRVALVDVGFLTYRETFDVIDLAGVTDPLIGDRPGAHCSKPVLAAELLAWGVDTVVLHSRVNPRVDALGHIRAFAGHPVERRLLEDATFVEAYRVVEVIRYSDDYVYIVFRRSGTISAWRYENAWPPDCSSRCQACATRASRRPSCSSSSTARVALSASS